MLDRMGEACHLPLEEAVPAYARLDTDQLKAKAGQPEWVVVDVRDSNSFNGWPLDGDTSGGRIAGAVNVTAGWVEQDLKGVAEVLAAPRRHPRGQAPRSVRRTAAEAAGVARLLETKHGVARSRLHVYQHGFDTWGEGRPADGQARPARVAGAPAWLDRERKANPKLRVFLVSWDDPKGYEAGHIPGSFYLDTNRLETPPIWDLVSRDKLVEAMLAVGVTADTPVVVYGPQPMPSFFAAAVMRHVGVKDVRVLNGGFPAWRAAGLPVEKGANPPTAEKAFGLASPAPDVFIGIGEARNLLADPNKVLVDVRSWREFIGETPGYDDITAKGRIPGAVWGKGGSDADSMEDYRNPDGTLRDHRDIERAWRAAGITPDKAAGFHCGTGWRACEAYLAARMMGRDNVVIYDGGWYEWSADPNNPVATGDPNAPTDPPPAPPPPPWWNGPIEYALAAAVVLGVTVLVWRARRPRTPPPAPPDTPGVFPS